MSADLVGLLKSMFPKREEAPSFLLVGHSMVSLFAELLALLLIYFIYREVLSLRMLVRGCRRRSGL